MKTTITTAFILLCGMVFAQSAEENNIKETLKAETTAFMNRDYDAWASHWDQEGDISFLVTSMGMRSDNWEEVSQMMKEDMENNPEPMKASLQNSDYQFSIDGDRAFVTYLQNWKTEDGDSKSYEIRNLRKVDGEWKLASMVTTPLQHEQTEANVQNHLRAAGIMLEEMERYDDGIKVAETFAEIFPDSPDGYWGLGAMYLEKKDKENALKYLEKARTILPDNAELEQLYEEAQAL